MFFPLKDKSHLTSSYLPHIVQPQFKKIKIGYFCYHLFNKETLGMPYKKISASCQQNSFPLLCPQDKEKHSKDGSRKI